MRDRVVYGEPSDSRTAAAAAAAELRFHDPTTVAHKMVCQNIAMTATAPDSTKAQISKEVPS